MRALVALAAAAAIALAAPAAAADWQVVPGASSLGWSSQWTGRTIEGRFARWQAAIRFDPARLEEARVQVVIDLASAATGDRTVDGALPQADWFASAGGARAVFSSSDIRQAGRNRYVARGMLELRGRRVAVELPFELAIAGNEARMRGRVVLDRRGFGIGMQSDAAASWVSFAVPVEVSLVARRR